MEVSLKDMFIGINPASQSASIEKYHLLRGSTKESNAHVLNCRPVFNIVLNTDVPECIIRQELAWRVKYKSHCLTVIGLISLNLLQNFAVIATQVRFMP